jgi:putative ABC transport system permease protein
VGRALIAAAAVGFGSLRENPLRTVLSTLGVIIGVGALVSVLSLGDAMQGFVRGELDRTTDLQLVVMRAKTRRMIDGVSTPVHRFPVFTPHDLAELDREVPRLRGSAMLLSGDARVSWPRSGKQRQVSVSAATAGIEAIVTTALAAGRLYTRSEAAHNAPVIVLSYLLADELANGRGAESMIGAFVRVRGLPRQVIGVFAHAKGERGYAARVPYDAAGSVFGAGVSLATPQVMLKAERVEDIAAVTHGIEDWLGTRYREGEDTVDIATREAQLDQTMQGFQIMKLFLGTLAGISLLVGGIGIMNIMLANVTERTREIGVRKAIGARDRDIRLQFLTEAVAVSCFGSAVGVVLGASITAAVIVGIRIWSGADQLSMIIAPSTVLVAAVSAVTIGLVFGTYPARRAGRLSPIDAIRHE